MKEDAVTDLTRGVYRRLYSGFIKGQRINKLSLPAEAWFWRILATVDDFGNGDADPELCYATTAGRRRAVTAKQVSGWLREMKDVGLVEFYEAKGEPYLHVIGFEASQPAGKNGKRFKRYPFPDESGCIQVNPDLSSFAQASENTNENTNEDENNNESASRTATAVSVFDFWRTEAKHEHAHFTDKRRKRVLARLKEGYSLEQIQSGIRGCLASPFHQGENDSGHVFDDLELICRDGEHLEKFIAISKNGVKHAKRETASERNVRNLRESLAVFQGGRGEDNSQESAGFVAADAHGSRERATG